MPDDPIKNLDLGAQPMKTAPRDGTMMRLLVAYDRRDLDDYDRNPLADSADPTWTIGFNNFDNDAEDRWQTAGWNWTQDCFCDGKGEPIGWLPFHGEAFS